MKSDWVGRAYAVDDWMFRAYLLSDGHGTGKEALLGWTACGLLSSDWLAVAQRMTDTDFLPKADPEG